MGRTIKVTLYDEIRNIPKDLLWQKRVYKKDDTREFRRLYRELDRLLYGKKNSEKHSRYPGMASAFSSQQRCTVKVRIGKDTVSHTRFIKEYLPQENKKQVVEKPRLFNEEIVTGEFLAAYQKEMAERHFKIIISPESPGIDIPALVKTLIKRVEKITGHRFLWMAAVHTDTDHPHAHLLINGRDKQGNPVRFDKVFITQTLREMNRQICTEMIGKRSREEIKAAILQSHKTNRYCALDEPIRLNQRPAEEENDIYESQVTTVNDLMRRRLCHLCEIGLAKKREGKRETFLLEKDWQEKLKAMGRYNSYLKARSELRMAEANQLELFTQDTGTVGGIVTKLYRMNDEDSWNHAILMENRELKKAWYVPLYFEPDEKLLNADIICSAQTNQKGLLVPRITVKKWNAVHREN